VAQRCLFGLGLEIGGFVGGGTQWCTMWVGVRHVDVRQCVMWVVRDVVSCGFEF